MASLLLRAESTREIPLTLDEEILGRSGNCSVSIHSVIVSRRHAEFRRNSGSWTVRDLDSVNGIYVNYKKIEPPHSCKLKSEDLISFGPIRRTDMAFQFIQAIDDYDAKLVSLNTVFWLSTAANKLIYTPAGISNHGKFKPREIAVPETSNDELEVSSASITEDDPNTEQVSPPLPDASTSGELSPTSPTTTSTSTTGSALVPTTTTSSTSSSPRKGCASLPIPATALTLTGEGTSQQDIVKRLESIMEEELTCSICSELFMSAVTLPCGHNFCHMCIRSWRRKKDTCPMCNSPIVQEIRSYVLDSVIKQLVSLNPLLKKHYDVRYKRYAERFSVE